MPLSMLQIKNKHQILLIKHIVTENPDFIKETNKEKRVRNYVIKAKNPWFFISNSFMALTN